MKEKTCQPMPQKLKGLQEKTMNNYTPANQVAQNKWINS